MIEAIAMCSGGLVWNWRLLLRYRKVMARDYIVQRSFWLCQIASFQLRQYHGKVRYTTVY
jgi:hypothetical protein